MKLILHDVDFNNEIDFEDGKVLAVECKNQNYFSKLVGVCKGDSDSGLSIIEKENSLDLLKDALTVIDFYSFQQYEKNILNKFYKYLDSVYVNDSGYSKFVNDMAICARDFFDLITEEYDLTFDMDVPMQLSEYLKFFQLKPAHGFTDKFDGIVNFIVLNSVLKSFKILIFINAKSFYSEKDIIEIYKCCAYNGQKAIFFDNIATDIKTNNDIKILIEEDFYDILLK